MTVCLQASRALLPNRGGKVLPHRFGCCRAGSVPVVHRGRDCPRRRCAGVIPALLAATSISAFAEGWLDET